MEGSESPLTVWVGEAPEAGGKRFGPRDYYLANDLLFGEEENPDAPGFSRPLGRDERLRVIQNERFPSVAGDQSILVLEAPRLAHALLPGQFLNIAPSDGPLAPGYRIVQEGDDWETASISPPEQFHLARVPLSMLRVFRDGAAYPSEIGALPANLAFHLRPAGADRVSVAVRVVGTGTRALYRANAGESLRVLGPLGSPERVPDGVRRVALLGGGVGFAPLFALAEQCHWRHVPAIFLAGARVREHLFPWPDNPNRFIAPEFHDLRLDLRSVSEEQDKKYATDLLAEYLDSEEGRETDLVYVCGPHPMMAAASRICRQRKVACRAFLEKRMECGIGVCMSCVTRFRRDDGEWANVRVCREGSVFDAERVKW